MNGTSIYGADTSALQSSRVIPCCSSYGSSQGDSEARSGLQPWAWSRAAIHCCQSGASSRTGQPVAAGRPRSARPCARYGGGAGRWRSGRGGRRWYGVRGRLRAARLRFSWGRGVRRWSSASSWVVMVPLRARQRPRRYVRAARANAGARSMQAAFGAYAAQERSAGLGGIEVKDRQAAPAHDIPGVLVRQGAAGWETVGQGRRGKALTARSSGRSRGGNRPRKKRSTATATGRSTLGTAAARCRVQQGTGASCAWPYRTRAPGAAIEPCIRKNKRKGAGPPSGGPVPRSA